MVGSFLHQGKKIRNSGLWLVNELYKTILSLNDFDLLKSGIAAAAGIEHADP
jgi:hypothetical protein